MRDEVEEAAVAGGGGARREGGGESGRRVRGGIYLAPSSRRRKKENRERERGKPMPEGVVQRKKVQASSFSLFLYSRSLALFPFYHFFFFHGARGTPASIYPRNRRYPFWQAIFPGKNFLVSVLIKKLWNSGKSRRRRRHRRVTRESTANSL